jgi:putative DNA primase/helicase
MADQLKRAFHEQVADRLIEQLQQGTAPWQKPWEPGEPGTFMPHNPATGKRYKGINAIRLLAQGRTDPRWMTYKQAAGAGAQVRTGEKGTAIQYWKFTAEQTKVDQDGQPVLDSRGQPVKEDVRPERPRVFFATVFNAQQIDGLPPLQHKERAWNAEERAEQVLQASGAAIHHGEHDRAFYRPATDRIHLPERAQFPAADRYYATALHELGHWSGHPSRLDRDLAHPFGSEGYAKEELRAEIASMILGDELGIGHDPGQHAAYVGSWIKVLQDDPLEVFRAAADAEKIQDYVLALELRQVKVQATQQEPAVETNALAADLALVFDDQSLDFSHFEDFQGDTLETALRGRGINTVRDVVGHERSRFFERAVETLSPVFGIEPTDESASNAYLERKGLAQAFVISAERLVMGQKLTRQQLPGAAAGSDEYEQAAQFTRVREEQIRNDPSSTEEDRVAAKEARKSAEAAVMRNDQDLQRDIAEREQDAIGAREAREEAAAQAPKTYLKVPYKDKDEAKQLGARWDRQEQGWFVPQGLDTGPFAKWLSTGATAATAVTEAAETNRARQTTAQAASALRQGHAERLYLAVPYGEHKAAKAAGAMWDKGAKSWYAGAHAEIGKLRRWLPENVPAQQAPAMSPRDEFAEAMRSLGCIVTGEHPIMDGKKHRVTTEGDKAGEAAGFYVGHLDGHPAGYIKNNRTGIDMKWRSKGYVLDAGQKAELHAEAAAKLQARAAEQQKLYERTAERVSKQLAQLVPADQPTPYMLAKGIVPTPGVFTDRDGQKTCIPATDANGKPWTMQYIQENGTKRFAKDSRKERCFHAIGGLERLAKAPALVIAEGYATAATLSQALGFGTVAAFDSGNLPAVAVALHAKFPEKPVIIAGDDDRHLEATEGVNPGKTKAEEAARAVSGKAIFPIFAPGEQAENPKNFTDFNDLATRSGLGRTGLERQVQAAVGLIVERHGLVSEQKRQQEHVLRREPEPRGVRL